MRSLGVAAVWRRWRDEPLTAALDTKITLHPCGGHLQVEITGTGQVERLLLLTSSKGRGGSTERFFGGWELASDVVEPMSVRVPLAGVR